MKRKRRKRRKPKSSRLPAVVRPTVETVSIVDEYNQSILSGGQMSDHNRRAFEAALHDQTGKTMLHLSAVALHKQMRQAKLMGTMDFVLQYISDPSYLKLALRDPDTAAKLLSLLHKIDMDDSKFLFELAVGSKKREEVGFDAQKALNLVIGLVGTSDANLPPELQNPAKLRKFRNAVSSFMELMKGNKLPVPPSGRERVITVVGDEDNEDDDVEE